MRSETASTRRMRTWAFFLHSMADNGGAGNCAARELSVLWRPAMKKDSSKNSKTGSGKTQQNTALQAGGANTPAPQTQISSVQRPAHWDRYVDSRMKQFCLR